MGMEREVGRFTSGMEWGIGWSVELGVGGSCGLGRVVRERYLELRCCCHQNTPEDLERLLSSPQRDLCM